MKGDMQIRMPNDTSQTLHRYQSVARNINDGLGTLGDA